MMRNVEMRISPRRRLLVLGAGMLLAGGLLQIGPALAGAEAVDTRSMKKAQETRRVDVTADAMEIQDEKNRAIFTGNVKAVRNDVTLFTDRLVVEYGKVKDKDGNEKTEATFLTAEGHVKIVSPEQTITGSRAKMDVKKELLWVSGNVTIRKGKTTVRGAKLFANLKTNVSRVESGGKRRVHGVFSTK